MKFNREELEAEKKELQVKLNRDFPNPKDMRRLNEVTSLLITSGESKSMEFKIFKGNGIGKGTHNLQHKKRN